MTCSSRLLLVVYYVGSSFYPYSIQRAIPGLRIFVSLRIWMGISRKTTNTSTLSILENAIKDSFIMRISNINPISPSIEAIKNRSWSIIRDLSWIWTLIRFNSIARGHWVLDYLELQPLCTPNWSSEKDRHFTRQKAPQWLTPIRSNSWIWWNYVHVVCLKAFYNTLAGSPNWAGWQIDPAGKHLLFMTVISTSSSPGQTKIETRRGDIL